MGQSDDLGGDYERWLGTLRGLHFLAFAMLMTHRFIQWLNFTIVEELR